MCSATEIIAHTTISSSSSLASSTPATSENVIISVCSDSFDLPEPEALRLLNCPAVFWN